jgi:hypothetical protein
MRPFLFLTVVELLCSLALQTKMSGTPEPNMVTLPMDQPHSILLARRGTRPLVPDRSERAIPICLPPSSSSIFFPALHPDREILKAKSYHTQTTQHTTPKPHLSPR